VETHRKLRFQLFECPIPMTNDGFPHLITVRDVGVDKALTEDHTQPSKLWAFDDTNRLKICEREEIHTFVGTHLVIRNDKGNEVF
jgi:hypothetical protein